MEKDEDMDYKNAVLELIGKISDDDIIFLRQIYTIIKKHTDRQSSHT
jgi:hypothetical protein